MTAAAMTNEQIVEIFFHANALGIDENGIRIPNMIVSNGDGYDVHGLGFHGPNLALLTYKHVASVYLRQRPQQLIFGMDRYALPDQDIPTKDFLSVHFWTGKIWRLGVLAYQHEPRIVHPIDWQTTTMRAALRKEMESVFGNLASKSGAPLPTPLTVPLLMQDEVVAAAPPPRTLVQVVDRLLAAIPKEQLSLRVELAKQKESALYTAPEAQRDVWDRTASALQFYLGRDPKQLIGWQREVFEIFTGERR